MNSRFCTRRQFLKEVTLATSALSMAGSVNAGTNPTRKPNILLILTDDQGWGDVRSHGVEKAHDPEPIPSPDRIPRGEVYEKVWASLKLGTVNLSKGRAQLRVRALTKPGETVMDLKAVVVTYE